MNVEKKGREKRARENLTSPAGKEKNRGGKRGALSSSNKVMLKAKARRKVFRACVVQGRKSSLFEKPGDAKLL